MSQYSNEGFKSFPNDSANAVSLEQHRRVTLAGNRTLAYAAQNEVGLGTLEVKTLPNTETGTVRLWNHPGTRYMVAAGPITAYADCFTAANGKIASNGAKKIGIALDAATANGDWIEVLPQIDVVSPAGESPVELVDAATIAIDASFGQREFHLLFTAAVGNTRAFANPTGMVNDQLLMIIFDQDPVGGRSISSWGSKYRFSGGVTPTFTVDANKRDILLFRYDAAADKLDHLATQPNL